MSGEAVSPEASGRVPSPGATRVEPLWLTPDWPAPANVRALSTLRGGGFSTGGFASLNLAAHVGDDAATVAMNRAALRVAASLPREPCWLNQRHGTQVRDLDAGGGMGGADADGADAAVTRQPGRICAILTADCLPVLLATDSGDRVGAAHAGWRGLAAGVIEAAVRAVGCAPERLLAWLGPAIGPRHFEVGAEVRLELLHGLGPEGEAAFLPNARGRYLADLYALARLRLARAGVLRVYGGGDCTFADAARFFSHRRDRASGRQATLIWMEEAAHGP